MKMMSKAVFSTAVVSAILMFNTAASADTLASSGFDLGSDGWLALNGASTLDWVGAGGATGSYIRASDQATGSLWFFAAPAAYTGDQSAAYGAQLSFALRSEQPSTPLANPYAQVQLLGNNGVLLTWSSGLNPGSTWTPYTVSFDTSAGWALGSLSGAAATEADIRGVLGDLKALRIRGDYGQAVDTTGLDNVSLVSAVPEPSAAVLMLLGVAGLAAARRRA